MMSIWLATVIAAGSAGVGLAVGAWAADRLRQIRKESLDWFSDWAEARKAADLRADLKAHRAQGPLP